MTFRSWLIGGALLALSACSLPAVSGTMQFPDGSQVQYAAKTVESSAFNSSVIVATKTPDGFVDTDVKSGTSVAGAVSGTMSGLVQGLGTFGALCLAAGNC
jgi:hypothetical protein